MTEDDRILQDSLRALAARVAGAAAPPRVEEALLRQLRAARSQRRSRRWMVPIAAALALVVVGIQQLPSTSPRHTRVVRNEAAFVPIVPQEELVTLENGIVVTMPVPAASLVAYGIPVDTGDITEEVEADVLLGQDGIPRAIRRRS